MTPAQLSLFSAEIPSDEAARSLADSLPEHSRQRLMARRYRAGSVMGEIIRLHMMDECGAPYDVAEDENGKPYSPVRDDISFNLSHSGKLAVGALLTLPGGVGVDVELIDMEKIASRKKIAVRFFAARERAALEECVTDSEAARSFYLTWTRKEAYLKYKGTGIACRLSDVDTTLPGDAIIKSTVIRDSSGEEYALSVAYSAGACVLGDGEVGIKKI